MDKTAIWLKESLDYEFQNVQLLEQALTHRSAAGTNNERLEYLGDAVLDFVISEVVYLQRPDASEGVLSRLRSSLVKDATLAELSNDLGIGDYLILGSGEKKSGGHRRASILADALEAIFCAVFWIRDSMRRVASSTTRSPAGLSRFRIPPSNGIPKHDFRNWYRPGK